MSSARDAYTDLFAEFDTNGVMNVLAKNEEVNSSELIVTVQKLLRGDIFGLEKYFVWGVPRVSWPLRSSSDKDWLLSQADTYAQDLNVHPRLAEQFSLVVHELVTNALYNAPLDADGRPRHAHLPRSRDVKLRDGEEIVVTLRCDAQYLGVSIADSIGALSKEDTLGYLARCFRRGDDQVNDGDDKAGAGLGLYLSFSSLSHLVINIAPTRRTEVIGLLDIRGSYRDFATRSKSFNIFVAGPG